MDAFYFFWNTFNLIAVLTLAIGSGILAGAGVSIIISVVTQIEDSTISFFSKFAGCFIGIYLFSSFILSSLQEFTVRIWGGADIFK